MLFGITDPLVPSQACHDALEGSNASEQSGLTSLSSCWLVHALGTSWKPVKTICAVFPCLQNMTGDTDLAPKALVEISHHLLENQSIKIETY